jgi:predicted transcriptional regulator
MGARAPGHFIAYAVCLPAQPAGFAGPQVLEAMMLLVPADLAESHAPGALGDAERAAALGVGTSCRICPRSDCVARREPSIMGEAP